MNAKFHWHYMSVWSNVTCVHSQRRLRSACSSVILLCIAKDPRFLHARIHRSDYADAEDADLFLCWAPKPNLGFIIVKTSFSKTLFLLL